MLYNKNGQTATSFQTNQTGRHSRCFWPPPSLALCAVTLCPSVHPGNYGHSAELTPQNFSLLLSSHSTILFGRQYVQPQTDYISKSIICVVCRNSSVGIVTRYGLDSMGDRNPVGGGATFFSLVQIDFGDPPIFLYNTNRVSFLGVKRPDRDVDHAPHIAPRLKKE
jgi:hypothetical protein